METLIENKDLIAMYEKQSAVSALIKGAYLEYFPANTLVWAGGNIDGKEFMIYFAKILPSSKRWIIRCCQ